MLQIFILMLITLTITNNMSYLLIYDYYHKISEFSAHINYLINYLLGQDFRYD